MFATEAHIDNRKQQYLLHMSSQYCGLRLISGWDLLESLRHPCKFQRVSSLGSVTARHSSSGRQPNFAALNRGRHLYSGGRPSRWALATFLVICYLGKNKWLSFAKWRHYKTDETWFNTCSAHAGIEVCQNRAYWFRNIVDVVVKNSDPRIF